MFPYFLQPYFEIGGTRIYAFGVCVGLAVAVGCWLTVQRARREGMDAHRTTTFLFWTVLAGFVVSHLEYLVLATPWVFVTPSSLVTHTGLWLNLWSGMASFGGILGGVAGAVCYARRAKWRERDVWVHLDALAYAFPFAWAIARFGCYMAHDHPGVATTSWLGVQYPDGARWDLGLMDCLFSICVAAFFVWCARRPRAAGFYLVFFLGVYGAARLGLDALRVETRLAGWTAGHVGAVLSVALAITIALRVHRMAGARAPSSIAPSCSRATLRTRLAASVAVLLVALFSSGGGAGGCGAPQPPQAPAFLMAAKSDGVARIPAGGALTYLINISYEGLPAPPGAPNGLTSVEVVDTLPQGVRIVGQRWSRGVGICTVSGQTVTCSLIGGLGRFESAEVEIRATAPATPGVIRNIATVRGPAVGPGTFGLEMSASAFDDTEVVAAVVLTCPAAAQESAVEGQPYQRHYECTDGDRPLAYRVTGAFDANGQGRNECSGLTATTSVNGVDIQGTPTSAGGVCQANIEATDSGTPPETVTLSIQTQIIESLNFSPTAVFTDGGVGTPYDSVTAPRGGSGDIRFQHISGTIPLGMRLSRSGTGALRLSGTPTAGGVFTFEVEVTDNVFPSQVARKQFTVRILEITSPTPLPSAVAQQFYTFDFQWIGFSTVDAWSAMNLPSWMTLNPLTGRITGTPPAVGTVTFTIQASAAGVVTSKDFSLTVATLTAIAVTPANQTILLGATQQFTATGTYSDGSTRDITNQVTWESSDTGVAIIGAPGLAGAAGTASGTVTITATDASSGLNATARLTITSVTVVVQPGAATVTAGATTPVAFSAVVQGAVNTAVTWSIVSGPGTVDASGNYAPPASANSQTTATVRATSVANPAVFAEAQVTINLFAPTPLAYVFAAGTGGVTTFGLSASGNLTRLTKALSDADATGVAIERDLLAVTFLNGTLVTARINRGGTLTRLDTLQNLGAVSNPRFHGVGTSDHRLYVVRQDPTTTIDAYNVNGATGQLQQIQGAPLTGIPAGAVSFSIDQANGQIILHAGASTFVTAHVLDSSGRVSAGTTTFDTTIYANYTPFSSGVHGAAGKKDGEVEIYVFDPNTALPQNSPITSVFLNSPISGMESHPTQVCVAVNTDLGGGTRKTLVHLDSLSGAASTTSSADFGVKLGYGLIVIGGADASATTLQGFVVNAQAGPLDLGVSGFAPVSVGGGSGPGRGANAQAALSRIGVIGSVPALAVGGVASCTLDPSITGSGQTFDGGAVEVAAFPLFPSPVTSAPTVSVTQSCAGGVCNFVATPTVDASLELAGVWFDFEGDGTFDAFGTNTSHTYPASGTFQMVVRVLDSQGRRSETTVPVTVTLAQAPVASFTASCSQRSCTFDGAASSDADGTIVSYVWDFGDGGAGSGVSAIHGYAADGTFTVRLTVTDNDGLTHSVTQQVTVAASAGPGPITDILFSKGDGQFTAVPFVGQVRHDAQANTLIVLPPAVTTLGTGGQPGPLAGDNVLLAVADQQNTAPVNTSRVVLFNRDAANNWVHLFDDNVVGTLIRGMAMHPARTFVWYSYSALVSGLEERLGVMDVVNETTRNLAPLGTAGNPRAISQLLVNPDPALPFVYGLASGTSDVSNPEELVVWRYDANGDLALQGTSISVPFANVMALRNGALYIGTNLGVQYVVPLVNGLLGPAPVSLDLTGGSSGLFGEAAFAKTVMPPNTANVCKYTLADVDRILMMEVNDQTPSISAPVAVVTTSAPELMFSIAGHPTAPFLYVFGDAQGQPPAPPIPLASVAVYEVNPATCGLTFRTGVSVPMPPGPLNGVLLLPQ